MSLIVVVALVLQVVQTIGIAAWFGCQVYSVTLVQTHPAADRTPRDYEEFTAEMANGSRWQIVAGLGLTVPAFIAQIVIRALQTPPPSTLWTVAVSVEAALFLAVIGTFVYLSWHVWPLRIFALPRELPAIRRTFYRLSLTTLLLLGGILALGVVAPALP